MQEVEAYGSAPGSIYPSGIAPQERYMLPTHRMILGRLTSWETSIYRTLGYFDKGRAKMPHEDQIVSAETNHPTSNTNNTCPPFRLTKILTLRFHYCGSLHFLVIRYLHLLAMIHWKLNVVSFYFVTEQTLYLPILTRLNQPLELSQRIN